MQIAYRLLLCFILMKLQWSSAAIPGVCNAKDESGNSIRVCCADFEEKERQCKPCAPGYTSIMGQLCQPCPPNTYGKACLKDCNCQDFQRCDTKVGCIDGITPETSTVADHTSSLLSDGKTEHFQTTSLLHRRNTKDENNSIGFSNREVIVYYTLSLAVVILMVCLCFLFIKYKRRKTKQTVDISIPRNESVNQIIDNRDQIEVANFNLYDEIDETEMVHVAVHRKPEVINNDYLEVVHVSASSTTSSTKSNKSVQNGYLNPYQPCVSTNETGSSYEKLKKGTVRMGVDNNKRVVDSQAKETDNLPLTSTSYDSDVQPIKRTSCGSDNLLSMVTNCSNKLNDIGIPAKAIQLYMQTKHREWNGDKERKLLNSENRLSFSSVDLKKNMHSCLSLSKKYKTF